MANARFLKLLQLYKANVPFHAQRKLKEYTTRRDELAELYKRAVDKGNAEMIESIKQEGLEVREYIQALT